MEEQLEERIVVDPDVMAGKPIARGTRILVDALIRRLAAGMSMRDVLDDYPNLQPADVKAALEYGARVMSGEENSCWQDKIRYDFIVSEVIQGGEMLKVSSSYPTILCSTGKYV